LNKRPLDMEPASHKSIKRVKLQTEYVCINYIMHVMQLYTFSL
jgi:hypothetical protein